MLMYAHNFVSSLSSSTRPKQYTQPVPHAVITTVSFEDFGYVITVMNNLCFSILSSMFLTFKIQLWMSYFLKYSEAPTCLIV